MAIIKTTKKKLDTSTVTRTIYGLKIQTARFANVTPSFDVNETINERFGFLSKQYPSTCPDLGYFMIGTNGKTMGVTPTGDDEPVYRRRQIRDNGIYAPRPFVLRELHNDLTESQRAQLRGRVVYTHTDGKKYWAYWLKTLDEADTTVKMWMNKPQADGSVSQTRFIPEVNDLSPKPPAAIKIDQEVPVFGDYGSVEAIVKLTIEPWLIDEMLNAKRILTGTDNYEANEWALLTGVDTTTTSTVEGVSATYKEVQAAQCAAYLPLSVTLEAYAGKGLKLEVTIGNDEPLTVDEAANHRGVNS